jgi:hypothetical protein
MNRRTTPISIILRPISLLFVALLSPAIRATELPDLAQLKLTAESGDAVAQFEYGQRIIASNPKERIVWIMKSAEQSYAPAQDAAAVYCDSRPIFDLKKKAASNREAARWASRAAFQGLASAQSRLGGYYYDGTGLAKDVITAYMWKKVAMQNPAVDFGTRIMAKGFLDQIIANTTSVNIQEGERRAAAFKLPGTPGLNPVEADLIFAELKLSAIYEVKDYKGTVLNNVRFSTGETKEVKLDDQTVLLTCLTIEEKAAGFAIAGTAYQITLPLNK